MREEEEIEERRDRYVQGVLLRVTWTSLTALAVLGALAWLTVAMGWGRYALLCGMGLAAGASVSIAAAGSARGRELAALVVGGATLPALAAVVAGTAAARSETTLGACGAALLPFLVHAGGAVLAAVPIAAMWRTLPPRPPAEAEDEAGHGTAGAATAGAPVGAGRERAEPLESRETRTARGSPP